MIHVRTKFGEFKSRWLKIETNSPIIRDLFNEVRSEGVGPSEGPTDYAIAVRIAKEIGGEYQILKFRDYAGETTRKKYGGDLVY